ncbi:MAG TPA: triose-phosphate isomerase [Candidatus Saccharimonadales bacterium]|nr:triose-phosphate isomerase [Candidatus Saccharimonadales bacterium]
MSTKRTLIVANWKMNLNVGEASLLVHRLHTHLESHRDIEVVLAPSLLDLQPVSLEIDRRRFRLAAQNAFYKDSGAYTGEVSFTMLHDLVHYAIIGHSERRIYFTETLEVVRDKVQAAIRNEITPILCVGETKQERTAGETRRVIHDQLTTALYQLTPEEVENLVIAYEPVWAISTFDGEVAKPDDIQAVFEQIRAEIKELYGRTAAEQVRVLYGGSVDADTAPGYLALPDCDGTLVGAASLNYHQFAEIVAGAYRLKHEAKE